ncbi:hypothetical protein DFH06DRAFT_1138334 [Mycena polygramma]|nr:hypothetical protein DFH06DRAFT_1138334 [Mycena polygramma]
MARACSSGRMGSGTSADKTEPNHLQNSTVIGLSFLVTGYRTEKENRARVAETLSDCEDVGCLKLSGIRNPEQTEKDTVLSTRSIGFPWTALVATAQSAPERLVGSRRSCRSLNRSRKILATCRKKRRVQRGPGQGGQGDLGVWLQLGAEPPECSECFLRAFRPQIRDGFQTADNGLQSIAILSVNLPPLGALNSPSKKPAHGRCMDVKPSDELNCPVSGRQS